MTVSGPIDAFSGLVAQGFQNTRRQHQESKGSEISCCIKEELLSKNRKVMTECIAA